MKNQLNELMMSKVERCVQLLFILEKLKDIEWESQYDSESDYMNDIRSYEVELSMLEGFVEELKTIINK
jgi:hypothetical protein